MGSESAASGVVLVCDPRVSEVDIWGWSSDASYLIFFAACSEGVEGAPRLLGIVAFSLSGCVSSCVGLRTISS